MESLNPGGTGKDRAARSMILDAERRGELPPPSRNGINMNINSTDILRETDDQDATNNTHQSTKDTITATDQSSTISTDIPANIHNAIVTALHNSRTSGILIEGTSGSTGISLASISCTHGHGVRLAISI